MELHTIECWLRKNDKRDIFSSALIAVSNCVIAITLVASLDGTISCPYHQRRRDIRIIDGDARPHFQNI